MNVVQEYRPLTQGVSDRASRAQFANNYANAVAAGSPRYTAKQYDRAGLSRGAAQMNQAGIDAAQNLADGVAAAYSQKASNDAYNANAALQSQQMQEANAQQLASLQSQEAYANAMAALQRQQAAMNFFSGLSGAMGSRPTAPPPSFTTPPLVGGILNRLLG